MKDKQGDHDHRTGKWRGVLCGMCNKKLGWYETLKNNLDFVRAAEAYLSKGD
jgi:hypothetical protein